jgi:hypothetical protein
LISATKVARPSKDNSNSLLTRDKTYERKFKEALMALLLELSFDKKEILVRQVSIANIF